MRFVFFETPLFSRLLPSYLDDAQYRRLQDALMREPERGDVMPGTAGSGSCDGVTHVVARASEAVYA